MNKRIRKKKRDQLRRLLLSLVPVVKRLNEELASFENPDLREASERLTTALTSERNHMIGLFNQNEDSVVADNHN